MGLRNIWKWKTIVNSGHSPSLFLASASLHISILFLFSVDLLLLIPRPHGRNRWPLALKLKYHKTSQLERLSLFPLILISVSLRRISDELSFCPVSSPCPVKSGQWDGVLQWPMTNKGPSGLTGYGKNSKRYSKQSMYYMLLANSSDWVARLQMMLFLIAKSLIHFFFFCLATDLFCCESSH